MHTSAASSTDIDTHASMTSFTDIDTHTPMTSYTDIDAHTSMVYKHSFIDIDTSTQSTIFMLFTNTILTRKLIFQNSLFRKLQYNLR